MHLLTSESVITAKPFAISCNCQYSEVCNGGVVPAALPAMHRHLAQGKFRGEGAAMAVAHFLLLSLISLPSWELWTRMFSRSAAVRSTEYFKVSS